MLLHRHNDLGAQVRLSPLSLVQNSEFAGYNSVGKFSRIRNCRFGTGSYVGSHSVLTNCSIGSYCSIASHVSLLSGDHPVSGFFSTSPSFYSPTPANGLALSGRNLFEEFRYTDPERRFLAEIGNDVWLAGHVRILQGVRLGDGCVAAAGAVITKDVEPYAIVGGVPARLIRYRFPPEIIRRLLQLRWWEKSAEELARARAFYQETEAFLSFFGG